MEIVFGQPLGGRSPRWLSYGTPFVFAGGGVRPEARRRGAGSLLPRSKPQLDSFGVSIVAEAAVGLGFATARHGNAGRAFFSAGETASNVTSRVTPSGP